MRDFSECDGLKILSTKHYADSRGLFSSTSIQMHTVDMNISKSNSRVVRGLHYQEKYPQAKIVTCLDGFGYDLAVDLRKESKTYGLLFRAMLNPGVSVFVPKGFAHGLISMEKLKVCYLVDSTYIQEYDTGIRIESFQELSPFFEFNRSDRDKSLPIFSHGATYL